MKRCCRWVAMLAGTMLPVVSAAGAPWRSSSGTELPLWPGAAPDMGGVSQPPETIEVDQHSIADLPATMAHDVTVPTLTIFCPHGRNTGAALVVFPGGGFQMLAMDLEGTEVCDWVTSHGMTCALLKYRVPRSNTYGDPATGRQVTPKVLRALQDAQRAVRVTRAHAAQLGIDPHRIGVIGFSADGYLVAQVSNILAPAYQPVDAIDRLSSRPDFAVAAYPGHLCREGDVLDPTIHVTKTTPPTFLVQNWDDPIDDGQQHALRPRARCGGRAGGGAPVRERWPRFRIPAGRPPGDTMADAAGALAPGHRHLALRGTVLSVVDVYQRHGAAWAALRATELVEAAWLDRFCALLPASTVLDIGCGSGLPLAGELVRRGHVVTGVDAAATMLALFRRNLPGIEAVQADMRELALSRRFAGLLAWDSFFHLPPECQRAMFARFQAHAAPDTPLMFTSGACKGEAVGELEGDPLYHGSLAEAEYRARLEAAGFVVVDHVRQDRTCGNRTVWLARQRGTT